MKLKARNLGRTTLLLCMAGMLLSCGKQPSAIQVYQSLLDQPLSSSAKITDWRIIRGIGELYAFFSIEMRKEDFESGFSHEVFVRNTDEEDAEFLAIYGRDISKRMGRPVQVPSSAIHLTGKFPGRTIHVFWQESSGRLLVWIVPGPSG